MVKSKLIDIFKSLKESEIKELHDFVRSPFHNRNRNVIKLFEKLKNFHPAYNPDDIEKKKLFTCIFPGKEYNDLVMRILISDLLKLSEDYLVVSSVNSNSLLYQKQLLYALLERKIYRLFETRYKSSQKHIIENEIDEDSLFLLYELENIGKGYNIITDRQHLNNSNLDKMCIYLTGHYISHLSSVIHNIKINIGNFNIDFDKKKLDSIFSSVDIESIKKIINGSNNKYSGLLELYLNIFQMLKQDAADEYFFRSRQLLMENLHLLKKETKYNLFMYLLSYSAVKNWTDKSGKYMKYQFEIYKDMLVNDLHTYSDNSFMTIITFRDILIVSTAAKEFEWQEKFINDYIPKLAPEQRLNMYNYSMAKYSFAMKNFGKALEHLTKVKYNLFAFRYDVKSLMLQIYYELGYYEEARGVIDSFKHFLNNNNSVSGDFKVWNNNFLLFYNELLDHISGHKPANINELKEKINNTSTVASKNWLINKTIELSVK